MIARGRNVQLGAGVTGLFVFGPFSPDDRIHEVLFDAVIFGGNASIQIGLFNSFPKTQAEFDRGSEFFSDANLTFGGISGVGAFAIGRLYRLPLNHTVVASSRYLAVVVDPDPAVTVTGYLWVSLEEVAKKATSWFKW